MGRGRVVSPIELGRELVQNLREVDKQIEEIKKFAKEHGIEPEKVRDSDGGWQMVPLLAAKAQLLHALTLLNARDK